jgi:dTDP-4-dehydrorhamnose reductase
MTPGNFPGISPGISQPVLLLGAGGMLGRAWTQLLAQQGRPSRAFDHQQVDFSKPATIEAAIDGSCPVVVNCAAWTDVDGAEAEEAKATQINGHAVGVLARCYRQHGALLVHYSTDYVFDGCATEPYAVDAPRNPVSAYGRSKAVGEQYVEEHGGLIVRTSWLYAPWGRNFVRTIARLSRQKSVLSVVDDQRGRPTSCEHLAATTLRLIERGARGVRHVTDGGECTWHELASAVAAWFSPGCRVGPCTTAEFPRPAPRPAYSVLDLSLTEAELGAMPHWRHNLADVLRRLEEPL